MAAIISHVSLSESCTPHQGTLLHNRPVLKTNLLKQGVKEKDLERIRQGMWLAANELGGTARSASVKDRNVCAKTGTAQTVDKGIKSHDAWDCGLRPTRTA